MVAVEENLVPCFNETMPVWLRYMNDTFTLISKDEIGNVLNTLNGFHPSIKFTYEKENFNEISFLDVQVKRYVDSPTLKTDIYRKKTDTNIYINWNSFSPNVWKIGTLKGLLRRACKVCSEKEWTNKDIKYLKHVFINTNQYPKRVVDDTACKIKEAFDN